MENHIDMNDNSLKFSLLQLKEKIEEVAALKRKDNEETKEDIDQLYKSQLVPILLSLRKRNRQQKLDLESKHKKVEDLNMKLLNLQQTQSSLEFQASIICGNLKDIKMKPIISTSTLETLSKHEARMKELDEEAERRRELSEELTLLKNKIHEMELSCLNKNNQLEHIKPDIREFLNKISPSLECNHDVAYLTNQMVKR